MTLTFSFISLSFHGWAEAPYASVWTSVTGFLPPTSPLPQYLAIVLILHGARLLGVTVATLCSMRMK